MVIMVISVVLLGIRGILELLAAGRVDVGRRGKMLLWLLDIGNVKLFVGLDHFGELLHGSENVVAVNFHKAVKIGFRS